MGIKSSFNNFLREKCPEVFNEIHLSEYAYKKVAIDISLYLNKYKAIAGDRWLTSFIHLISCLRRNELHCVFIFDGKSPIEKQKEQEKRRSDRQKLEDNLIILEEALDQYHKTGLVEKCLIDLYNRRRSPTNTKRLMKTEKVDMVWVENKIIQKRNQLYQINPEDFEQAKELFRILNVPFFTAVSEAEKLCAKLCIDGKVDAVLSEDTDVMAYGTPIFLSKIDTGNDTCIQISNQDLLEQLNMTQEQFLDFCIMCGTDYNTNIPKVGSKTAYKHIQNNKSIEEIGEKTVLDISILNHVRVRELFTNFEDCNIDYIPYCGRPNFEELQNFVTKNNIKINIDKLTADFVEKIIILEDSDQENNENIES